MEKISVEMVVYANFHGDDGLDALLCWVVPVYKLCSEYWAC